MQVLLAQNSLLPMCSSVQQLIAARRTVTQTMLCRVGTRAWGARSPRWCCSTRNPARAARHGQQLHLGGRQDPCQGLERPQQAGMQDDVRRPSQEPPKASLQPSLFC